MPELEIFANDYQVFRAYVASQGIGHTLPCLNELGGVEIAAELSVAAADALCDLLGLTDPDCCTGL